MTEENQKDRFSSQMNIKIMHLTVPKHNVLVIILKKSYLEKVHNNIVPIYIADFKQCSPQIITLNFKSHLQI